MSFVEDLVAFIQSEFPDENIRVFPEQEEKTPGIVIQESEVEQVIPGTDFLRRSFSIFFLRDTGFSNLPNILREFSLQLVRTVKNFSDCFGCEGFSIEVDLEDAMVIGKIELKIITKGG